MKFKSCKMCGCDFNPVGPAVYCPSCRYPAQLAMNIAWYQRNREKVLERKREEYRANPKKFLDRNRAYRASKRLQ